MSYDFVLMCFFVHSKLHINLKQDQLFYKLWIRQFSLHQISRKKDTWDVATDNKKYFCLLNLNVIFFEL